jgi:hypothetical protein
MAETWAQANATLKPLSEIETSKRLAAYTAVDQHVKPEHKVGVHRLALIGPLTPKSYKVYWYWLWWAISNII